MEKMNETYRSIDETEILSDEMMDEIEAGNQCTSCGKACNPGNQNAGNPHIETTLQTHQLLAGQVDKPLISSGI